MFLGYDYEAAEYFFESLFESVSAAPSLLLVVPSVCLAVALCRLSARRRYPVSSPSHALLKSNEYTISR